MGGCRQALNHDLAASAPAKRAIVTFSNVDQRASFSRSYLASGYMHSTARLFSSKGGTAPVSRKKKKPVESEIKEIQPQVSVIADFGKEAKRALEVR